MLRHEIKKLFSKHFGLTAMLIVMAAELLILNFSYPKENFANDKDRLYFSQYMSEYSGKLTAEKEQRLLAEQEAILDAYNAEQTIMLKLGRGEYSNEEEFRSDIDKTSAVTERKPAFEKLLAKYEYAADDYEKRYILNCDYDGFASDRPDVPVLVLVILMSAMLFLGEESSNVITFIRISANGKAKSLRAKLVSLFLMIAVVQLFRVVCELIFMSTRGVFAELLFPLQSIEYFGTSEYDLLIIEAFFIVSVLRLLGYLFISALIILLSVTLKKPLFTVFIPCAVCVLQQFVFLPEHRAYYLPTGLLRAVGYFRGSDPESTASMSDFAPPDKRFIAISGAAFVFIIIITITFLIFSILAAARYYGGTQMKMHGMISALTAFILVFALCGCDNSSREKTIIYNAGESRVLVQNSDYYCVFGSDGITSISKKSGAQTRLFYNVFNDSEYNITAAINENDIYYCDKSNVMIGDCEISKTSLDTLSNSVVAAAHGSSYKSGFLGLSLNQSKTDFGIIDSIFMDGKNIFLINTEGRIYILKNGTPECLISEKLHNTDNVSFDGQRIYYINGYLELKSYDIFFKETRLIAGDFTTAVCFDGLQLIYSNAEGIFYRKSVERRK